MKILATLLAAALCASAMAQTAGTMDFVQGSATVVGVDGARRPARTGATLAVGETVETGTDGEVHAVMADGGMLALRAGSLVKIGAYRAIGDARDESKVELLRGALRAVTGWIAKVNPRGVTFITPTATTGVRGTDFDLMHFPAGTGEQAGSHVRVRDGAVAMQSEGVEHLVGAGQAGHAPGGGARPRLHERIPDFVLRSEGRNDGRVGDHGRDINRFMETSMRERRLLGDGESLGSHLERRRGEVERERGIGDGRGDAKGDGPRGDAQKGDGNRAEPRGEGRGELRGDGRGDRIERAERGDKGERIERPQRPERPRRPGQ